jgi:predicted DNA binding protein
MKLMNPAENPVRGGIDVVGSVCSHAKREEIEADFFSAITEECGLTDRANVYRHANALGLLTMDRAAELRKRALAGEKRAALAREFGISRETLYSYLARPAL